MKEQYTGIPKYQDFARAKGGQTPFSANREPSSTWEDIRNYKPPWSQTTRKSTLTEIRDLLRRQERRQEIAEQVAFSKNLNEKLFGKRQEAPAVVEEGEEKLTLGKLVLMILAAILSAPANIAEQTAKDAREQAEKAA
jgi:hypothetical protein